MTDLIAVLEKANMMLTSLGANNTVFLSDAKKEVFAMQKREEALVKALENLEMVRHRKSNGTYTYSFTCYNMEETYSNLAILKSAKEY